jgi:hypothetical protein
MPPKAAIKSTRSVPSRSGRNIESLDTAPSLESNDLRNLPKPIETSLSDEVRFHQSINISVTIYLLIYQKEREENKLLMTSNNIIEESIKNLPGIFLIWDLSYLYLIYVNLAGRSRFLVRT